MRDAILTGLLVLCCAPGLIALVSIFFDKPGGDQ